MLNANLNYQIFDWLSVSGRVWIDNSNNEYTKKLYAMSYTTLTNEGSDVLSKGAFMLEPTIDQQIYVDLLVNINVGTERQPRHESRRRSLFDERREVAAERYMYTLEPAIP